MHYNAAAAAWCHYYTCSLRNRRDTTFSYTTTSHHSMAFNGLLFCTTCGNLLPRASKAKLPEITCELCQTVNDSM
jgi:hypothetical protein